MRTIKHLAIIGVVALMSACASTANFPVSSTVPAADITATKKQDKNKNYVIEVTARNLAEASRLNPPKNSSSNKTIRHKYIKNYSKSAYSAIFAMVIDYTI